jgi:hypothetical protein
MEDRIWILFARRVSGEITPEEQKELEALMREQPEWGHYMETILKYFDSEAKADQQEEIERSDRAWRRLKAAMGERSSGR